MTAGRTPGMRGVKRVRVATTTVYRYRRAYSSATRPIVITEATSFDRERGWPKYVLTHRATGMSVCRAESLRAARAILTDLLKAWTWDCGVEGVTDPKVTKRCRQIFAKHKAQFEPATNDVQGAHYSPVVRS